MDCNHGAIQSLSKKWSQGFAARVVPQSGNGFFLDLANPFPGEVEEFADFFQCQGMFSSKAKIKFDNFCLALGQGRKGSL